MPVRFRGRRTCQCVATILPLIEADMRRKGLIKGQIWITQAGYNAGGVAASAGTHDGGGVLDIPVPSDAELKVWRSWGFEMQRRTRAQGFSSAHGHGVLKGCPHVSGGARYQASEWNNGRNGLRGRGPITGPGPRGRATPTWKQAIKKHKADRPPAPPKPPAPKGILGMSKNVYFRNTGDRPVNGDGKWHDLPLSDKDKKTYSALVGPNQSSVLAANVILTGLKQNEHADVSWRLLDWKDGKTKERSQRAQAIAQGSSDGGPATGTTVWSGTVPKGARLRVSVRTSSKTAQVKDVVIQGVKA